MNKRNDYRYSFTRPERLPVQLSFSREPAITLPGVILNLSVGGMALLLEKPSHLLDPETEPTVVAEFQLPQDSTSLAVSIQCRLVHQEEVGKQHLCGLRFLPLPDPEEEKARDKQIWLYLMDQQRRLLRARR